MVQGLLTPELIDVRARAALHEGDAGLARYVARSLPGPMAAHYLRDQSSDTLDNAALHDELLERHNIEVPAYCWPAAPQMILRISAQAYNHAAQYERLAEALERISRER